MNPLLSQLLTGIMLAAAIAGAAFAVRSLNLSGAIAAFILGTVIFGVGGLNWAVLLMGFFLSSSLLSRLFKNRKKAVQANFSKGSRRDAGQVAANGAIAGLCAMLFPLLGESGWLWVACAGALAAANADTWATEIGVLGKSRPRLITTGRVVEPGTSGGVSFAGILAALGGSLLIAVIAVWLKPASIPNSIHNNLWLTCIVLLAGLVGSLVDSFLGATWEAMYYCDTCRKETEKHPQHGCGTSTRLMRGSIWLNNDWVNLFCTLSGSLLAAFLALFLISSPLSLERSGGVEMQNLTITTTAFADGKSIPQKYSCFGENLSPALKWDRVPSSAKSLALIMEDPDAPMGTFTHWVVYNLPASEKELAEGIPAGRLASGAIQGINSARQSAYMGPCPPAGKAHRYFFKLFALDLQPTLPEGLTNERLTAAMNGHILAAGEWMGTYQR